MSKTVAIQVRPDTVTGGFIEAMVGADNYEYVTDQHVKVFGKDAKEPEWIFYDGERLNISKSKTLKELYYEVIE